MRRIFLFFLLIIISIGLVRAIAVEQSVTASVTINPFPGRLNVNPEYLDINSAPLSFVEKELIFQQDGNVALNVSLDLEEMNGSFSADEFTLNPAENKSIKVYINIPETEGTYSANISAFAGDQKLIIPVDIEVTDKYKIGVDIDVFERSVNAGESISVLTKLTKLKLRKKDRDLEGRITVNLEYNVFKRKELITSLITTMDVVDYNEGNIPILIPADAGNGRYSVEVTATHLSKTAKDKDSFSVATNLLTGFLNFFGWFR